MIAALKARPKQLLSMEFGRKSEKPKPQEDSDLQGVTAQRTKGRDHDPVMLP